MAVPSLADYYNKETDQAQQQQAQQPLTRPAQLELQPGNDNSNAKVSATRCIRKGSLNEIVTEEKKNVEFLPTFAAFRIKSISVIQ